MKKILLFGIGVMLLSGCAGNPFCHPGRSTEQINKDWGECDYQAESATGSSAMGGDRETNQAYLLNKCMKAKGYGTTEGQKCAGYKD
jgi:hypothetical protein